MTYLEKIEKLLQDRGIALSSLSSAYKEEIIKTFELNFYYTYLFGTGGDNIGLINILELYYKEINIGVGRTTDRPALQGGIGTSEAAWKTAFNNAIKTSGDDSLGFYPPDGNNIGDKNFNDGSNYLTTNNDQGETTGGIVGFSLDAVDAIGSTADTSTGKSSPDFGVGIIGQRTADNTEVETNEGTEEDPNMVTTYGDGTADNPDWYNTPYKTNFESALQDIIDDLNTYKNHLDDIKEKLQFILDGSHALFEEASMASDMPTGDITTMNTLQGNIQQYIDDLQDELDYFSSFTASDDISGQTGYARATFDTKLDTTVPGLLTNIRTTLQDRALAVRTITNYNNANGDFRKWIKLWIKQSIGKYDGPLISLDGIEENVIPSAESSLSNANEALQILFGTEYDKYLTQPGIFAAYFNPLLNEETGDIEKKKVGVIWMPNLAANRYDIFRRRITNNTTLFDNTEQWGAEYLIEGYIEKNDKETMVRSDYMDESQGVQEGGLFIYRVKSFDTNTSPKAWDRLDTDIEIDTSSQQSIVVGKSYGISSVNQNVIELNEEVSEDFGICFIENKYYGVLKIKEKKITLTSVVIGTPSTLTEIKGGVYVP